MGVMRLFFGLTWAATTAAILFAKPGREQTEAKAVLAEDEGGEHDVGRELDRPTVASPHHPALNIHGR